MNSTTYYLTHAAELYSDKPGDMGPTGDHVEVVCGEVRDYGGVVLFAGTADECVAERAKYRIPTRLTPTEWKPAPGEVSGADHTWQGVIGK